MAVTFYLIMGMGGVTPSVFADVFYAASDCCTDCSEPDCPDHEGDGCPPLCADCVCLNYVSTMIPVASTVASLVCSTETPQTAFEESEHQAPVMPGIFRPPRLS